MLALVLSVALIGALAPLGQVAAIIGALLGIAGAGAACWLSLATQVKRWHDLDRTGWMVLINFIPFLGLLVAVIYLGFIKGTAGPNRFDAAGVAVAPPPPPPPPSPPSATEPPLLSPAKPSAPKSRGGKRLLAAMLGLAVLAVLLAAIVFVFVPGNTWEVRRSWMRASLGSAADCQALAWRYRTGQDVPQDFARAAHWFERAADHGLAQGQYDLAVLYYYGLGVPADPARAKTLLQAAVAQNYVPAKTLLGLLQESDESGREMAKLLWEEASAAGDPWAQSLLGSMFLARREQGDGKENLTLALYYLESARRGGAETVGGLLQHVWATVPPETLEEITTQVFGRLAQGKPDPITPPAPVEPPKTPETTETPAPADNPPAETAAGLGEEVLASVRARPEYVALNTAYAERSQADPSWAASDEGRAVGQYLQTMRTDAQAAQVVTPEGGKPTLEYAVGGSKLTDNGVHVDQLDSDADYRKTVVDALAQNIVSAPRPLVVSEFLKHQEGGDAK